jgi:hypothetical protein
MDCRDPLRDRVPPSSVSAAGMPSALFGFREKSAGVFTRNLVSRCHLLVFLIRSAKSSPPWKSLDLLQVRYQPTNQNRLQQDYTAHHQKGGRHNLINKSVNRTPPDTNAIHTRLLPFRETHWLQASDENMTSS